MKRLKYGFLIMLSLILVCNVTFAAKVVVPTEGKPIGIVGNIANPLLGIIRAIAIALATIMVFVIGIRYMSKGAGVKADVKDTILPYLIGTIVVAAASSIVRMVMGWGF